MASIGKGTMSPARKKQTLLLAGLGIVIVAIALVVGIMGSGSKPAAAQKPVVATKAAFGAPGGKINEAEVWRAEESANVQNLRKELEDLKRVVASKDAERKADEAKKEKEEAARAEEEKKKASTPPPPPPPPPRSPNATVDALGLPPSGAGTEEKEKIHGIVFMPIARDSAGRAQGATQGLPKSGADRPRGAANQGNGVIGQSTETYLPAGSFLRSVLLSGLDAPTGGQVQQNPHPIILRVTAFAQLPNQFKADYKECFVTGNGFGDISSERAYIRLDRLSCVTDEGGAIDVAIKGFISGEDGKAGIRGRLVSKQGQVLANALLAGIASGIGQGITLSSTTTSVSPLGSTQNVKDGEAFRAGMGQGIGKALDKLTQYYINLAEKMFPIIEIDAGRAVDVVITQGVSLERK